MLLVFLFTALLVAASWAIQMGYVEWFLNYIKQFGYFGSMAIVAGLMVVGTSPIGGVLYSAIQIGAGYAFGWPAWPAVYVGALVGDLIAYQFCSLWLLQGKTPEQLASAMPGKTAQRLFLATNVPYFASGIVLLVRGFSPVLGILTTLMGFVSAGFHWFQCQAGSNRQGVQGAHLNPLGLFLNPLGLFLRTSIPFIWSILSAFLRA